MCACEAENHWIDTGIKHGQYDSDFICVTATAKKGNIIVLYLHVLFR